MILDGYVRVSQVGGRSGERFISPAVQRGQIEGWANLHGHLLAEVFEELDESGARRDRPLLAEAIARVERGDSRGIVVAKLDRFGRSLLDGLAAIERITSAGGTFVSVADGLDFSTDTGRLVLRIMLSMGEWELDRVRSNWAVAQARAIARGVQIGPAPVGYRRDQEGRLVVDRVLGPVVTDLFRRRAEGASIPALCRRLEAGGVERPSGGTAWPSSSVRSVFRSRVYLGEVRHGQHVNRSAHPPLADPATWQRAQRPSRPSPRRGTQPALLRGVLRCAGCRRALTTYVSGRGTARERRQYGCLGFFSAGRCPAPAVIADSVVEPYLEALFWQELARGGREKDAKVGRLERAVERCEGDLARYRDSDRLARTLGLERFEAGLAVRVRRLEEALLALAAARREADPPRLPPAEELKSRWPAIGIGERRDALAELIDCVFVSRGRGPPSERLHVCLRGRAPADLPPSNPRRLPALRPFDPSECLPSAALSRASAGRWREARVRAALAPFLAGREEWPPFSEFQRAGLGLLFRQAKLSGGRRRWAREFGLSCPAHHGRLAAWPEERVREELERFLAGRELWPTYAEFRAANRGQLRAAVTEHGGPERWAEELGLVLSPRRRNLRQPWSEERVEAALREFTDGMRDWPPKRLFERAGRLSLYHAVIRHGGRRGWAQALGLHTKGKHATGPLRWTDEAIDAELQALLDRRKSWPLRRDFRAAGLDGLYQRIMRSEGGHDRWARRYRLERARLAP